MTRVRLKLAHQLFVALVAPAILSIFVVAYLAERVAARALDEALGAQLCAVAEAAATLMDAKILLLEPGDDEARPRQNTTQKLAKLKEATSVDRIILFRMERATVILDTQQDLRIGDEYLRARFDAVELEAVGRGESRSSFPFESSDGHLFKTGYAPFRDGSGRIVAAVGVHAPATYQAELDALRADFTIVGVVVSAFIVGLALLVARAVSVPLSNLSDAARQIGEGQLETHVPQGGPAEAAVLASTMQSMAASLKAREQEMQMMLAGIAHEVRNPLGGMELFGGLLKEDLDPDDPRQKHVAKMLKELQNLSKVVSDFLEFARKRPVEKRETPILDLLQDTAALSDGVAREKQVVVETISPPELVAHVDPEGIKRALLNLVRNSIQAVPTGGRVRLSADRVRSVRSGEPQSNADQFEIIVEDNGPGIPANQREQIFAPFFTTKQKGTGLGLALVRKTVDAHGGQIEIGESSWKGARFRIVLPL